MSIHVIWDDEEQTILRQIYADTVSAEDYYHAIDMFTEMAQGVSHPVYSILDRTKVVTSSGSMLSVMRYGNRKLPKNIALRIILRPTTMTRIMVDMGKRIAPNLVEGVVYTQTLEEAYKVIQQHKQTHSHPAR